MRVSLNFLKEFLDIDMPIQQLVDVLTMAGMEVEGFEQIDDDWVFDIEVTTNRYDWLSVVGIAREVAACLGKKIKIIPPHLITKPQLSERDIVIENLSDCPLYVGRSLKNAKIIPAPKWLKDLVTHCGLNSINNVVDITNYCMLKWGNPLHAFDEDKIEGNVYVRRAKEKESFIGIDSKERVLSKENLVIADDKKIIALAGVMGAKNTEVSDNTKNIFLEAAIFSPLTVRRSRRIAGLDTDSSYRFERQVFSDNLMYASGQASSLIEEMSKATFNGYKCSGKKQTAKPKTISLFLAKLNDYIGQPFNSREVKNILECLGFVVKESTKKSLKIIAPQFRFDINSCVDVYEEVSRIYGYEKIQPAIPFLKPQLLTDHIYNFKNDLRDFLYSSGLREVISYSIVAEEEIKKLSAANYIMLSNPLRKQENAMRPTLLPGIISSIRHNLNRGQNNLKFFEIADIYSQTNDGFTEVPAVSFGLDSQTGDFFMLKAFIIALLKYLNIEDYQIKEEELANFANALMVYRAGKPLGFLGKLNSNIAQSFDLKTDIFFAQFDVKALFDNKKVKSFKGYSSYPAISRDISFMMDKKKKFSDIKAVVEQVNYFSGLKIIDIYRGKNIPQGFTALTLRIFYQSGEQTLSSQQVDIFHNDLRQKLSSIGGVTLR